MMDMRTSKYSEEQIIGFLRQAEAGMPVKEIGRKHGFSDASFYKWRSKYGGMDASEAKRLRELELENGKLKRLLAEAHLDIHALKSAHSSMDRITPQQTYLNLLPKLAQAA
jgi:putative transposase